MKKQQYIPSTKTVIEQFKVREIEPNTQREVKGGTVIVEDNCGE